MLEKGHDVIVVGAGAAGATLAARLSEDPHLRVLLIEAGGKARGPLFSVPLMTGVLLRSQIANWGFSTQPQAGLNGRSLAWPRGKALGGSTAINGMVYMRGLRSDFDGWGQLGLAGWSFADVEPTFRVNENAPHAPDATMGRGGPLEVSRAPLANPLFRLWLEAAAQAGHRLSRGFNGPDPEGVGVYDFTIRQGRRASTARAFLDPAAGRPNLTVETRAEALRVQFEGGRAIGVVVDRNGRETLIRAAREVVLCAGAVNTPRLLMLSGIGDADALGRLGIPVAADLPGVGRNLQDHLLVRVTHATDHGDTYDALRRIDRAALAFLQAWARGTGPAATFPIEVGGLLKSDPSLDTPDLQTAFLPGLTSATLRLPFIGMSKPTVSGAGFFSNVFVMRPESRGEITLASADPRAAPLIDPRYLSAESDLVRTRAAVRILRDIFAQSALDAVRGPETAPGPHVRDDAALDAWIRATADTVYHPVGTAAMGPDRDRRAVLDARLRVRGVEGLRVADASAMPRITSCNTMAPTIMIAQRCADFMRATPG